MPPFEIYDKSTDLHIFLNKILAIFTSDFWWNNVFFWEQKIGLRRRPYWNIDGKSYEWTFHHIVTKEDNFSTGRIFCESRAVRIRFPKHYINSIAWLNIWSKKKKGDLKYYISDSAFDYLVVLSQRKGYVVLISAFPLDSNTYKSKMKQEFTQNKFTL